MKKVSLILSIAVVPLLIGGCSLFGGSNETTTTEATPTPTPNVSPSPESFPGQTQPGGGGNISVSGLIPSTDPATVTPDKGRVDPFAVVPIQPRVNVSPNVPENGSTTPENGSVSPGTGSISSGKGSVPAGRGSVPGGKGSVPGGKGSVPGGKGSISSGQKKTPPPPPQPTEALAVLVSGVVDLPTSPMAIVTAPGEKVTRSVTAGDSLSNGQVLVRAIYPGSDNPIVILEQYGQQVAKQVGGGAVSVSTQEVPSAPQQSIQGLW